MSWTTRHQLAQVIWPGSKPERRDDGVGGGEEEEFSLGWILLSQEQDGDSLTSQPACFFSQSRLSPVKGEGCCPVKAAWLEMLLQNEDSFAQPKLFCDFCTDIFREEPLCFLSKPRQSGY